MSPAKSLLIGAPIKAWWSAPIKAWWSPTWGDAARGPLASQGGCSPPLKEVHGAPINEIMHFYDPQKSA